MLIAVGIIVVVALVAVIGMFNSLVGKRNQVQNIFGTMDAMLKKRWDLIPNLVATVKGYMQHEKGLFENLTALRSRAEQPMSTSQRVQLDNDLTKTLAAFSVTVENYPNLKASENCLHLQRTLNELEEQISAARRAFNAAVTDYNNAVDMFPTNILAGMMNFQRSTLFEIPEAQRQTPTVSLQSNG
jgi:LemA protein